MNTSTFYRLGWPFVKPLVFDARFAKRVFTHKPGCRSQETLLLTAAGRFFLVTQEGVRWLWTWQARFWMRRVGAPFEIQDNFFPGVASRA